MKRERTDEHMILLSHLRKNARQTLTNLSRATSIPVSTIFDRIKHYVESGWIVKYTALIDFQHFGYSTRAKMAFKIKKENKEDVRSFIEKHKQINGAFRVNNGFDFLIEGVFKNMKDLEEFLENFENKFNVQKREVFYIIEDIKRESFLSSPDYLKLIKEV